MSGFKQDLADIVGKGNVAADAATLDAYAHDESFALPIKPRGVVRPQSVEQVQSLVKWANETQTPLVPVSSGAPHFRGDTVPSVPGAVMVDMSAMNKIIRIDRRSRNAIVEPGVTYAQIQAALAKEGMHLSMPLAPRKNKSVVGRCWNASPPLSPATSGSLSSLYAAWRWCGAMVKSSAPAMPVTGKPWRPDIKISRRP